MHTCPRTVNQHLAKATEYDSEEREREREIYTCIQMRIYRQACTRIHLPCTSTQSATHYDSEKRKTWIYPYIDQCIFDWCCFTCIDRDAHLYIDRDAHLFTYRIPASSQSNTPKQYTHTCIHLKTVTHICPHTVYQHAVTATYRKSENVYI